MRQFSFSIGSFDNSSPNPRAGYADYNSFNWRVPNAPYDGRMEYAPRFDFPLIIFNSLLTVYTYAKHNAAQLTRWGLKIYLNGDRNNLNFYDGITSGPPDRNVLTYLARLEHATSGAGAASYRTESFEIPYDYDEIGIPLYTNNNINIAVEWLYTGAGAAGEECWVYYNFLISGLLFDRDQDLYDYVNKI